MSLSGYADLPLHGGHVPRWLAELMKRLGKAIINVILMEFGSEGLLRRLSNPLWFQALNNAIGMDWDSSGSTTVTTAIIKDVLKELNADVRVAGGKGRLAVMISNEIVAYGDELGIRTSLINELIKYSRLSAKVDSVLLQDSFDLYHHVIAFDSSGKWVVIQQGMNLETKLARRYHIAWFVSSRIDEEPHSGIASDHRGIVLNLTDRNSRKCKDVILDLMYENPIKLLNTIHEVNNILKGITTLDKFINREKTSQYEHTLLRINTSIPYYKPVRIDDKMLGRLKKLYEFKPSNIEEALLVHDVGAEVFRALSLISELIYREPPSLNDPVTGPYDPFKYSFIVGGKDGIPFPVKKEVMVSVIKELEEVINEAKLGRKEKLLALGNLRKYAPRDVVLS